MHVIDEPMPDTLLIELQVFGDDRGSFVETFNRAKMADLGIDHEFVQDNQSFSRPVGTVRGLHLQLAPHAQGKLVRVLTGAVMDIAVDVRPHSSTYEQSCSVELRGDDDLVFWIPPGFAHGFCTLEPDTTVVYKTTALYAPESDRSIHWLDPRLGIQWPIAETEATLSAKDAAAPRLDELEAEL